MDLLPYGLALFGLSLAVRLAFVLLLVVQYMVGSIVGLLSRKYPEMSYVAFYAKIDCSQNLICR